MLNLQKQENENITDELTDSEKYNERLEGELKKMQNVKSHIIKNLEELLKKLENVSQPRNIRQDLSSILQFIFENSQDKISTGNINSNANNYEEKISNHEDDTDKKSYSNYSNIKNSNHSNSNRSSYVVQNYEKFKQSQEALKKNTENKLINQGITLYKFF